MRVVLAALVATVILCASVAGSVALSVAAIDNSQHKWCTTLVLLTKNKVSKPADPTANPSRENAYIFYSNLKHLERSFNC
jgi:hypothetical protein